MCISMCVMETLVNSGENQVFIYFPMDSTNLQDVRQLVTQRSSIYYFVSRFHRTYVVVSPPFDMGRKVWNISRKLGASFSILTVRELYVVVTRAQRRVVVILVQDDENKNLNSFFHSFPCEVISSRFIVNEFLCRDVSTPQ